VAGLAAVGLVLVFLAGCGKESDGRSTRLKGRVTLDGAAIAEGTISFLPEKSGQSPPASARIADGYYDARAVPLGKVRVQITATRETGRMIPGSSQPVPEVLSIIPPKYAQGISIEVTGDNPQQDFPLTSKQEPTAKPLTPGPSPRKRGEGRTF